MTAYFTVIWGISLAFQNIHFSTPAGTRPAAHRGNITILPGGRVLAPAGSQIVTGPGAFGLAVSPGGRILTANLGPERMSVSYIDRDKKGLVPVRNLVAARVEKGSEFHGNLEPHKEDDGSNWKSVFMGITFSGEKSAWIAEGNSGRVSLMDLASGIRKHVVDLNGDGFSDSFAGDLTSDPDRGLLYVTDPANLRIAVIDIRRSRLAGSVSLGRFPVTLALSENRKSLYVTNVSHPGGKISAGEGNAAAPNDSLAIVNVEEPSAPRVDAFLPLGPATAGETHSVGGLFGVVAGGGQIFISNSHTDSITIVDSETRKVVREVNLRLPGLETLRGILPLGMAYEAKSGILYAAAAGINAVAVIDLAAKRVSFLPSGWFPTRVVVHDGYIYATNAKGHGTGPNVFSRNFFEEDGLYDTLHRGSVSCIPIPDAAGLKSLTQTVLSANGFVPVPSVAALPKAIQHVVLIVKEGRTFDEVFGDVGGTPALARFGATTGYAGGDRKRFSLQRINVTPNHHALARSWMMSDNFYADSEDSLGGHQWLAGSYPDAWTESSLMAAEAGQNGYRASSHAPGRLLFPSNGAEDSDGNGTRTDPEDASGPGDLWRHLERHHVSFRYFGGRMDPVRDGAAKLPLHLPLPNSSPTYPPPDVNIPDQVRADHFIREIEEMYTKPNKPLPRFLFIRLPNDQMAKPRPADGYSYQSSYVADNDYALGRIIEYLSHSPWWKNMAVFVTEASALGGRDHIDSHRTILLGAGPYFKKDYVLHTNSSFPGLLKTIFRLLQIPPLNLYDATAADLSDAFTTEPDFTPYTLEPEDHRLFDPSQARPLLGSKLN